MKGSGEEEIRSTIASTVGGVMTREVGAITGELEVATLPRGKGVVEVAVRYAGANEWYAVEGSPIKPGEPDDRSLPELHERIAKQLTRPGKITEGKEEPISLLGFALRVGGWP